MNWANILGIVDGALGVYGFKEFGSLPMVLKSLRAFRDSTKDGQWAIVLPRVGDRREAGR